MIQKNQIHRDDHTKNKEVNFHWQQKLIIPPNNFWNMQWNNFIVIIFILYMFILPLYICFDKIITEEYINSLIIFDILFMIDRSADLFVGSYKLDG